MTQNSIADRAKTIVADQLGVEIQTITEKTNFAEDLGADSLDTVELVMALEEEFGVEIPDEDAEKIKTFDEVVAFLEDRLKTPAP